MYNVFVVAYPTGSNLEEKIQELLINDTETLAYATVIEEVNMSNVSDELFNYLTNGFKEEATGNV